MRGVLRLLAPVGLLLVAVAAALVAGSVPATPEPLRNGFAQATAVRVDAVGAAPLAPPIVPEDRAPTPAPTPGGGARGGDGPTPPDRGPLPPPSRQNAAATRPLGFLRVARDVLAALLDLLRAAGVLGLALWHRLGPSRLLESASRRALMEAVLARPGRSVTELAEALGVSRKTVSYHLRRLDGTHVALRRDGATVRVWPMGLAPAAAPARAERILRMVEEGMETREALAEALGVTPQAVSRHLGRLEKEGRLRLVRDGRRRLARPATWTSTRSPPSARRLR